MDLNLSRYLNKLKKVILVVNKVDDTFKNYETPVFYNLGFGDFYSISAINGSGTGDLLDKVVSFLEKK